MSSVSSWTCLCPIHWSQVVLSREWICSDHHPADGILMLLELEPWWINTNYTGIFPTLLATQASNGSDNGLVPTMRLAIIWTNGGQVAKANLHVKSGLVQVVEWPRTGVKPLFEQMSIVFPRSNLSMSWIELPSPYKRDRFLYIDKCVCTLKVISMDMY